MSTTCQEQFTRQYAAHLKQLRLKGRCSSLIAYGSPASGLNAGPR
ncbi:hypothetical protein Thiosp_03344 [Thiorhodovibrio litoralis]|nr:hypothetical protein Thiosp_03344 [Thiorhodovibrio litoralis]